jgi:negative regulator of flagellin synthesis FlgM
MKKIAAILHPEQFAAIECSLARVEVIDQARVAEIRRQIREGRFEVDSEVVADRLLSAAREMLTAHRA